MNYIWEILLAAQEEGITEEELRFQQAENPSPYMETAYQDMNLRTIRNSRIPVNPLYRFSGLFEKIVDRNLSDYSKTREIFLDVMLHYLAHTDLRMGLHKQEYYYKFLLNELENGIFGGKAKEALQLFGRKEKKYIVMALMEVYQTGYAVRIFSHLIQMIYENSIVYMSHDRANEMYLYVGVKESAKEKMKIQFLTDTFLPIGEQVRIFYGEHFGIVDVGDTMVLDHILLI